MKISALYIFFFFLFLTSGCIAVAQNTTIGDNQNNKVKSFELINKIIGNFKYINIDGLNNIYVITADNHLKKINEKGDSISIFNDIIKYGPPTFIDVSNPLKPLVYYKNYSTIIVLDQFLQFSNSMNLRNKNISNVRIIAGAYDNNIWIFDEQDSKIKKLDNNLQLLLESNDMRILTSKMPSPNQLFDYNKQLYLYDKKSGFYIFDYYGGYKNNLPFLNWDNAAINNNTLYGFTKNILHTYDLQSLHLKDIQMPDFFIESKSIKAINGKLYLLKKDRIEVYSIK